MMIFTLRFVFVVLSLLVLASSQGERRKPDQVIELFRHGARSPNGDYEVWSDLVKGQLTSEGMREHYQLGKKLSERYAHLIEPGYNPKDFYAVSNDVQRCIESALVHLTSVFRGKPSTLKGKSSPQESYQHKLIDQISSLIPNELRGDISPINVDIADKDTQLIFRGNEPPNCPNLGFWSGFNQYSPQAQQAWGVFIETISEANEMLPNYQQIYDIATLVLSYDAIIAAIFDKRTPPGNIQDEALIKKLELAFAYFIYHLEQGQEIQRHLSSFNTLDVVLREMKNFRGGKDPKKMVFLSGHDKNIYSVLAAFGIVNHNCLLENYDSYVKTQKLKHSLCYYPYYASNLVFELYNDPTDPYVQIYYNDVLIPLCNGQEKCSYNKFVKFVKEATGNNNKNEYNRKCTENPYVITQELEDSKSKVKPPKSSGDKGGKHDDTKPESLEHSPKHDSDPKQDPEPHSPPPHKDDHDQNSTKIEDPKPNKNDPVPQPSQNDPVPNHEEEQEIDREQPTPAPIENNPADKTENKDEDNTKLSKSQESSSATKIKALTEDGGKSKIVGFIIIFVIALSSIIIFLRVLLARRKTYIQMDPDVSSFEVA